jgi:hypothetical protein
MGGQRRKKCMSHDDPSWWKYQWMMMMMMMMMMMIHSYISFMSNSMVHDLLYAMKVHPKVSGLAAWSENC